MSNRSACDTIVPRERACVLVFPRVACAIHDCVDAMCACVLWEQLGEKRAGEREREREREREKEKRETFGRDDFY